MADDAGRTLRDRMIAEREGYQKRVLAEHDALKMQVDRLHNFIQSAGFDGVNPNEQPLLKQQLGFMQDYLGTLDLRIALHKAG